MGYTISLNCPVTGESLELPVKHLMAGSTFPAEYNPFTGTFTQVPSSEARMDITSNYKDYYYEAASGDDRFQASNPEDYCNPGGIRGIYGKSGAESIPMLRDMIQRIKDKYCPDGRWLTGDRERIRYFVDGVEITYNRALDMCFHGKGDGITTKKEHYTVNEGDTSDYWEATAANAIRPLYQLIAMAQLRPDGVWAGD